MRPQFENKKGHTIKNALRRLYYRHLITKHAKPHHTILDIGAGYGLFTTTARLLGHKVTSVDLQPEAQHVEKRNYKHINTKHDIIFASQIIEHINQFELMNYAKKHCTHKLIIITPKPSKKFWDTPDHIRPYTQKAIQQLMRAYSFTPIQSHNLWPTDSFIVIGQKN